MTKPAPTWPERLTAYIESPDDPTLADLLETIAARWPFAAGTYTTSRNIVVHLNTVPHLLYHLTDVTEQHEHH